MEVAIAIWLLFGVLGGLLAKSKKRTFFGWFLLGLLVGPFALTVGLLSKVDGNVREAHPAERSPAPSYAGTALYEIKAKSLRSDWGDIKNVIFTHLEKVPNFQVIQNDTEAVIATAGSARITATHELRKRGAYITVATVGVDPIDFGGMASRVKTSFDADIASGTGDGARGAERTRTPNGAARANRTTVG